MDLDQASCWEEYERTLEQKQSSTLYRLLPGVVQGLVYGELVTAITNADGRRRDAKTAFGDLTSEARELRSTLEAMLQRSRRHGDPLPADATNAIPELKELRAELDGLQSEQAQFLTTAEQSTVTNLATECADLAAYLSAKREFDGALAELETELEELRVDIDAACDHRSLLSVDAETTLQARLNDVDNWQTRIDDDFADAELKAADFQRLDAIADRIRALQQQVSEYNADYVSDEYTRIADDAVELLDGLETQLGPARTTGEPLPDAASTYTGQIDPLLAAIDALDTARGREQLTDDQINHLENLRSQLQANRTFVTTKASFESRIGKLTDRVETLTNRLDGTSSYLTTPRQDTLRSTAETISDDIGALTEQLAVDCLAPPDQDTLTEVASAVDAASQRIEQYNEQFVDEKRHAYAEEFSGFGDENLALNAAQERAVFRNDIHNQVIAGAGTGKTFSLSCRVKYLVAEGVSEDEILTLTFTRKAADEMGDRLAEMFDITGVETSTLHSFGNRVLNQVDPTLVQIEDQSRLRIVGQLLQELEATDETFQNHYEAFREEYADEKLDDDAQVRREFLDSLSYKADTTLGGEEVDSRFDEEQDSHTAIADWLFKHDIDYRYRQYASWADNPNGEAYIPDFTIPEADIYIEYLPTQSTRDRKRWYEQKPTAEELAAIFEGTDKTLLTVEGDNIIPDRITRIIEARLAEQGLNVGSPLCGAELRDRVYEHNICWRDVEAHFAEFIKKAKTNQLDLTAKLETLNKKADPELYHFSHAATQVLNAYADRYETYNAYDFADMIVTATRAIKQGAADDIVQFSHVMVDEFQDLNQVQIEFVKALVSRRDARLFAVGDDWQSIYGFKGARPDYFIDFETEFPPATETRLETNYRCPPSVVQAGNRLIENNEAKTDKTVTANKSLATTPQVHLVAGSDDFQYKRNAITKLVGLVTESVTNGREPDDIMVLARNEKGSPFIRDVSTQLRQRDIPVGGPDGVEITTAHRSKGKEAGHVIIANAAGEMNDGFPPTEGDRNLTDLVEIETGSHLDEERRLFYVALTRAEERLDIQSRSTQQSTFLGEIQEYVSVTPTVVDCEQGRETVTVTVSDAKAAEPYWETRQVGELDTGDGYTLNFAITEEATDVPLLTEDSQYRLEDVHVGEYDGQPQFQIDTETTVTPVDPA